MNETYELLCEILNELRKDKGENEQHVYHHSDNDGAKVSIKTEKNTKGYNWEASVSGASSVEEAMTMLKDAEAQLKAEYGEKVA